VKVVQKINQIVVYVLKLSLDLRLLLIVPVTLGIMMRMVVFSNAYLVMHHAKLVHRKNLVIVVMELKIENLTHLRKNAIVKLVLKKIYTKETRNVKNALVIKENACYNVLKAHSKMKINKYVKI